MDYFELLKINQKEINNFFSALTEEQQQKKIEEIRELLGDTVSHALWEDFYELAKDEQNLKTLHFLILQARIGNEFVEMRTPVRPPRLKDSVEEHIRYAIEGMHQLKDNKENIALLESITVNSRPKSGYYDEFTAAYFRILMEAGFDKKIISEKIIPELKRIAKGSAPALP